MQTSNQSQWPEVGLFHRSILLSHFRLKGKVFEISQSKIFCLNYIEITVTLGPLLIEELVKRNIHYVQYVIACSYVIKLLSCFKYFCNYCAVGFLY